MAIYHFSAQVISRNSGRSSIAAAAYRAGDKLQNEREGTTYDFTRKSGIAYSAILLPHNAPHEYNDRQTLWNAVEKSEKYSTARTAREIEIALPIELTLKEQIQLVREYTNDSFVSRGMCADIAIHDKKDGNPHAHIMLTLRPLNEKGEWENKTEKVYICKNQQGEEKGFTSQELKDYPPGEWEKQLPFYKDGDLKNPCIYLTKREVETEEKYKDYMRVSGKKDPKQSKENRENTAAKEWNQTSTLKLWREEWAKICNREYEKKNIPIRLDHRSFEKQGQEQLATIHLGAAAHQLEKRGIKTERGKFNAEIISFNSEVKRMSQAQANSHHDIENEQIELREMLLRVQANQEQAAREQVAAEQAAKERAAKEQAERDAREKAASEQTAKNRDQREREGREPDVSRPENAPTSRRPTVQAGETKPPISAEERNRQLDEVGKQLGEVKNTYFRSVREIETIRARRSELNRETARIGGDISSLEAYRSTIGSNERKLARLQTERVQLGAFSFKAKGRIDGQIASVQLSMSQAEQSLQQEYSISKHQIPAKLRELQQQAERTERDIKNLPDTEQKQKEIDSTEQEYKAKKIGTDILPEQERQHIERAESDYLNQSQGGQGEAGQGRTLENYRVQAKIDKITPEEYQKIKAKLPQSVQARLNARDAQGGKNVPAYAQGGTAQGRTTVMDRGMTL